MERIRIDDGRKSYEIVNKDGDLICVLSFNPADTGLIKKLNNVINTINNLQDELNAEGDTVEEVAESAIIKMNDILEEKFADLFGGDAARDLFKNTAPTSPMTSGNMYITEILEAIAPVIEKVMNQRLDKVSKKMETYTAGYKKK